MAEVVKYVHEKLTEAGLEVGKPRKSVGVVYGIDERKLKKSLKGTGITLVEIDDDDVNISIPIDRVTDEFETPKVVKSALFSFTKDRNIYVNLNLEDKNYEADAMSTSDGEKIRAIMKGIKLRERNPMPKGTSHVID
jgi:hypothetical protein